MKRFQIIERDINSIYKYEIQDNQNNPTVAELFKGFGCQVCQAPASGIHFGAVTCEGCKVTTKKQQQKELLCE